MSDAVQPEEFRNVKAGEWVAPAHQGYLMKCCDCGLVHRFDYRIVKVNKNRKTATIQGARYHVQMRAYRAGNPGYGGYEKGNP